LTSARRFAGPAILLVLTVAFYWKLTLTDQYIWFDHPDMSYLELPRMQFQAREIHRARFPLWDPYIWCGQSLIGQTQPGPLFPLNLAFSLAPLDPAGYVRKDWLNWYYAAIHFLAALFAYGLARELRLPKSSSILTAVAFAFGGFMGTVPWIDVMNGAIWAPLVLTYLLRTVCGDRPARNAALGGLWLGVSWLSGHHELPLMLSLVAAGSWIYLAWNKWRMLRYAAVTFAVAGLVSAIQVWPTAEFARLSRRFVGADRAAEWNDRVPYTIHTVYSLPPHGVAETMLPSTHTYADTSPFLGGVIVSLALLGLAAHRHDRLVRWIAAAGALSLVYALGAFTPLHGAVYAISPMMARARVPARAFLFFNLSLAVLAAYGLQAPLEWNRRAAKAMAVVAALILAACTYWMYPGPAAPDRLWLTGLCLAAGAAALVAAHRPWILIAIVLVELTPFATGWFPHLTEGKQVKFASALFRNRDVADFLRAQPDRIRTVVNETDVPENFGDWHAIEMLQGYVAGAPINLLDAYMHTDRFRQLVGVTHYVAKEPHGPAREKLFDGASGTNVFRVPDPMPRAWAVHRVDTVPTVFAASERVQDPAFDFRSTASLAGPAPPLESCAGDEVKVVRHGSNRVTIQARMACRGMVILGDSHYPGWRAKVDGRRVPIHAAYGVVRGIVVDAGAHEIDMRFLPASFLGGGVLTLIGLVAVALISRRS
jgi:hypothetical protein